jgi:hypothetical protein
MANTIINIVYIQLHDINNILGFHGSENLDRWFLSYDTV